MNSRLMDDRMECMSEFCVSNKNKIRVVSHLSYDIVIKYQ